MRPHPLRRCIRSSNELGPRSCARISKSRCSRNSRGLNCGCATITASTDDTAYIHMDRFRRVLTHLRLFAAFVLLLKLMPPLPRVYAQNDVAFEISLTRNEMVPMRDAVRLATDIYRSARNGRLVYGNFLVIL